MIERRLLALDILQLQGLADFRAAAELYRAARREGITIRRTADCLIAVVCIRAGRPLLHNDAGFHRLASTSALPIVAEVGAGELAGREAEAAGSTSAG